MKLYLILISTIITLVNSHEGGHHNEDSDITKFMKHLEVIPDVITEGPKNFLTINFDSGVQADKGVELKPVQVKNQPKLKWDANKDSFYTIIMTDPDAPSSENPKMREWHHWLVGNVPGDDIEKGEILSEFVSSAPPKDTGLHRYVLLVYKQPDGKINFDEPRLKNNSAEGRGNFSTKKFIEKYKFGAPEAGNFYQAQYDDYVPTVHKQLGF
ncbi:protein D2-like [Condylostylus longicornis]|uniref:protein D2-like n=1 Tax=Condylostylus longicornis TaxID=2530218 RepID=UPI00244E4F10|nr:protein D2-like [Condylostylus longicornis]